ncbi:MAG TPA: PAS domain-containing sensor histidine kinase, partial [Alphaproteobacteria bacterium]|nr:PAS domain-containing sensor histidine kinase [Alphaproteobacteria bacterium]
DEFLAHSLLPWARRVGLSGKLALGLAVAASASSLATYAAWSGTAPLTPDPGLILSLLILDLALLLALGAVVARQLVRLWVERRSGSAGSRLHTRMVAMFSLVSVTPAILVAVFSALFFYFGVQSWFSERVRTAVEESLAVARSYVDEHRNTIRADILAMARDVNHAAPQLLRSSEGFNRFLSAQTAIRGLSEATVFDSSGRILARTTLSLAAAFDDVPLGAIDRATSGDVVIFGGPDDDQVRALVRLDRPIGGYLYVGRFVDPTVLNHVERTREVVSEYKALEGARSDIQLTSALIYIVVALLLLVVAVWLGLVFASRLVRPIRQLVETAEQVRLGDLSARVAEGDGEDEIGTLSRAFNRMTSQLEHQRAELVEANRQMDLRRRFTEAVLAGVSAGVMGLDGEGRITLPNRSAAQLLETEFDQLVGRRFAEVVPEMAPLLAQAGSRAHRVVEGQVSLVRKGRRRTFVVRVSADRMGSDREGFVVTFDDVTELMTAQRTAAWADVARRIAHEIKNPLTPIQLSAERLKRKYLKEVQSEPQVFIQCTDTIIRQVGDIGRMVDEFSAFARMPAAVLKPEDLGEIVRQATFPQQFARSDIDYLLSLPEAPVVVRCDARHVGQVLTNLLQNAVDAIDGRAAPPDGAPLPRGRIEVRLEPSEGEAVLEIVDNGKGLPAEDRERLTEPYVTTREKGTGLGLAIVNKIAEEHGWRLRLEDAPGGGACISLAMETLDTADVAEAGPDTKNHGEGEGRVAAHGS